MHDTVAEADLLVQQAHHEEVADSLAAFLLPCNAKEDSMSALDVQCWQHALATLREAALASNRPWLAAAAQLRVLWHALARLPGALELGTGSVAGRHAFARVRLPSSRSDSGVDCLCISVLFGLLCMVILPLCLKVSVSNWPAGGGPTVPQHCTFRGLQLWNISLQEQAQILHWQVRCESRLLPILWQSWTWPQCWRPQRTSLRAIAPSCYSGMVAACC